MIPASAIAILLTASALAASPKDGGETTNRPTEDDFYRIVPLSIPDGVVMEVGALEEMPDGALAVATRRGEIWIADHPRVETPTDTPGFHRFAHGLHEVLGLASRDGWLYAVQRGEVTRLRDEDGDGRADLFETVCDDWGISGDYHEYAFGSKFDRDGNLWVALCLTGSFSSQALYRGWSLRITPDGRMIPTCSGLRSPGGLGMNAEGEMFCTDNQGPWNGTCSLKHLKPGSFQGHPGGNRWYDATDAIGPRPPDPVSGSRLIEEADRIPELVPPAVYFPYTKMGKSASGIVCDTTGGKFGPFEGQMFVADQSDSTVMRVDLETVHGRYQGACFPFRAGFGSGNVALLLADDGSMYVGGTNRGWGSRGSKPFALERLDWTGKVPFEILSMRARPDGFSLRFTQPIDPDTASDPDSYSFQAYTYIYQSSYGSPEVDRSEPKVTAVELGPDGQSVRLTVEGLRRGHVHELHLEGIRSAKGVPLLHDVAYYTLNEVPGTDKDTEP